MGRPRGSVTPIAKDHDRKELLFIWAELNNPNRTRSQRQVFIDAAISTLRPRYLREAEGLEEVRAWLRTHPYDSLPDKDLSIHDGYESARRVLASLPRMDEAWTFGDLLADPEKARAFSAAVVFPEKVMRSRRRTPDGTGGRSQKQTIHAAAERLRRKYKRREADIDAWARQQLHKRVRDI